MLARLREGRRSLDGRTEQGVTDPVITAPLLSDVLVAGDTTYLVGSQKVPGEHDAERKAILMTSGASWSEIPSPDVESGRGSPGFHTRRVFVAGDEDDREGDEPRRLLWV